MGMSAATSTIITGIALGASAAGSVYSAKKQANTASQASQVQVDASNKAMDYQKQATQEARAYAEGLRTSPLQPLQGSAAGVLQQRLGVPSGGYGGLMRPPTLDQYGPALAATMPQQSGGYRTLLNQPTSTPQPGGMGQPQAQGGTVLLQAPTGEQKAVPAEQAQAYIARGARRIG